MSFETRLRARMQAAGEQIPGRRIALGDALDRARRSRRNYRFAIALAGTAVTIGRIVAGVGLLRPEAPEPVPPADRRTTEPSPSPTPSRPPALDEMHDDGLPDNLDFGPLTRAVNDFFAAAAASDAEELWALMSDEARARFDGFDAFSEFAVEVNAETLGAWAAAADVEMAFEGIELPTDEAGILVTVFGEVTQEGPPAPSQIVIPVRLSGSGQDATASIDAFTQADFEVTAISDGDEVPLDGAGTPRLAPDARYEVRTGGRPSAARISLVYERSEPAQPVAPAPTELELTADGAVARWQTEGVGVQGRFALVAAFVAEDGAIEVRSYPVRIGR